VSRQRGQVAPIFAVAAMFMIGIVALAVDFGATANQHRFLQDTADHAALAGAARLGRTPTSAQFTDARQTAFVYFRDNLQLNLTLAAAQAVCDFNNQVTNCTLPAPLDNYMISIWAPGEVAPGQVLVNAGTTVSVRITEKVTVSFAAALGIQRPSTQVLGIAQSVQPQYSNFAVYLDGCLNIGNHLELVAGDVYINQCTLNFLSQNQASFCAYLVPSQAGNLVFGPQASAPQITQTTGRTLAQCQAGTGDTISTTGKIMTNPTSITPPAFAPPPAIPACPVGGCLVATNNHVCKNHTVKTDGTVATNCYDPGAYTTIGLGPGGSATAPIANNLNPGVYFITGDTKSACFTGSQTQCPSVVFGDNTMNANFGTVQDACWAAPNAPALGNFTPPCPSGFAVNPLVPVDPQCAGATAAAIGTPSFTLTPQTSGGTLAVGTYYVRVTAFNGLGETASTEASAAVSPAVAGQGAIQVTIPSITGATGYVIYGPSTTANQEVAYPPPAATIQGPYPPPATVLQPGAPGNINFSLTTVPSGTTPYPLFANSSCAAGFHNVPRNAYENNGVTFVLNGKASLCLNSRCGTVQAGDKAPVVMLTPYCSTLANGDLPTAAAPCPYATGGINANDGAFVIYGNSQGYIAASGAGSVLALTGTLYAPQAQLHIDGTAGLGYAKFQVIPGQVVMKSFDVFSGNSLEPLVYYGRVGAVLPGFLRLVQ
jgi:Flp pilus assembly protein TadG